MSVRACRPELLRADPDRTAALVRRALETTRTQLSAGVLPEAFLRRARLLRQQSLELLARSLATNVAGLAMLLEALPPSRRACVFSAALQGADTASVFWPDRLLAALPHSLRHAEVRRMLGLAQVQRDPARRLALTAWLPVDEALPALVAEARAGKGEERARGWALRITCNASNRCGSGETPKQRDDRGADDRIAIGDQVPGRGLEQQGLAEVFGDAGETGHPLGERRRMAEVLVTRLMTSGPASLRSSVLTH
jgi:hypothetical protein